MSLPMDNLVAMQPSSTAYPQLTAAVGGAGAAAQVAATAGAGGTGMYGAPEATAAAALAGGTGAAAGAGGGAGGDQMYTALATATAGGTEARVDACGDAGQGLLEASAASGRGCDTQWVQAPVASQFAAAWQQSGGLAALQAVQAAGAVAVQLAGAPGVQLPPPITPLPAAGHSNGAGLAYNTPQQNFSAPFAPHAQLQQGGWHQQQPCASIQQQTAMPMMSLPPAAAAAAGGVPVGAGKGVATAKKQLFPAGGSPGSAGMIDTNLSSAVIWLYNHGLALYRGWSMGPRWGITYEAARAAGDLVCLMSDFSQLGSDGKAGGGGGGGPGGGPGGGAGGGGGGEWSAGGGGGAGGGSAATGGGGPGGSSGGGSGGKIL